MAGVFGAPVGIELAREGRRAQELHDLSLRKGEVELQAAQMTLESQKRMLELMQGGGAAGGKQQSTTSRVTDLADKMDHLAEIAMASGLPEKAKDYATAGSTIRKNQATLNDHKLAADIKEMNLMGSLLDSVKDEQSWRQANAMFQMQTGRASPWARLPYNEQLTDRLRLGVMNAKDRALMRAAQAREDVSEAEVQEKKARVPLINAQRRLADARTEKLKKAGATSVIPKASEIKAITDLMFKDFGGSMLPEDARVLARPIAEEMQRLIKDQEMTQSEAANRAYQNAKARGDFGGYKPRRLDKGSSKNPLPLPDDPKKLKSNMYYLRGGKTYLFTGTAFVPVGKGPGQITEEEEDGQEVESTWDTMAAVEEEEED